MKNNFQPLLSIAALLTALPIIQSVSTYALPHIKTNQRIAVTANATAKSQQIALQPTTSLLSQTTQNNSKQLVDEVWQIVDRTYIDTKFNGQDWKAVRQNYLNRSYKSPEEAYNAVDEMLKLLGDPQTKLLRPTTFSQSQADTNSEIVGIGVKLVKDEQTKKITVVTTIENSPAMKAGIKAGDIITKVDGKTTDGIDVDGVTKSIRGQVETSVTLAILRDGKPLEFQVQRQIVKISPVTFRVQETSIGKVGYIRLSSFNAQANESMNSAIRNLEKQNVKGYVFDLRSDSGGLIYSAIDITQMWLNSGKIIKSISRETTDEYQATNKALTNKPLVILVNNKTAAGSEIVASTLQENQRAALVGTQTVGANRIQTTRALENGSSLAVTTSKWLTSKGRDIYKVGLKPDVIVALTDAELRKLLPNENEIGTSADPQYVKALEVLKQQSAKTK